MQILIYSYNYFPEPIGIAPLMTELAEGLVKRGHQVRVVTAMPNYPQRWIYDSYKGKLYCTEIHQGVTIQRSYVRINGPHPQLLDRLLLDGSFIITSFWQALRGERPDVILATVPPLPICIPVGLYGALCKSPIILNVQDIVSEAAVRVGLVKRRSVLLKIANILEKLAYKISSRVTVIADGFRDKLLRQGVDPQKIVYIPNWVDLNFIRPLPKHPNRFRESLNLQDQFLVLYSGNIALTQGLQTVVEAAARLKHIPDIVFVIVGEPQALERLKHNCQEFGATNVMLRSFEPRENLPAMLAAADVSLVVQKCRVTAFNMPSKIPLILASGRAIVASVPETGTAIKAVQDSGGGVVVPPENPEALANQILALYQNPQEVERLGKQGRSFAEAHYGLEQALNQYEALFREVQSRLDAGFYQADSSSK